ncbi:hypothetical protein F475_00965 [Pseudomonas sp. URMO17WK12:I6]|jgi:hypothetical protein|uniref:hypothetical protein n=1 Tax=Pseudomonas sp. URMO17WK12:I6 TaxID=1261629 RepID=UPI000DABE593|nr:hypothetical protein [Pseudomonas sp. URMO17WK12:I6]PZW64892.1 hypothetical protein F475_00965 [Pseudomonas sp. URMO17WK12:I6]
MNAVIKQISFAPGNYVTAKAYANTGTPFEDFIATSRLIDQVKVGVQQLDAVQITAIDRPASNTKAKSYPAREIIIILPKDFPVGKHAIKSSPDVALSFKDDTVVSEAISGEIEIEPAVDSANVKARFKVVVENADETTFQLNGDFQVLKY